MSIHLNNGWRDYVRRVTPYVPGEQPRGDFVIKLNTNESPYPPSPMVTKFLQGVDADMLRKYPDPESAELAKAFAKRYHVSEEETFFGVGSDEILALAFWTFFSEARLPVCFADITYSFYKVWMDLFKIPYITIPLDDAFRIKPGEYTGWISGVVLANPNAPTGLAEPLSVVEGIVNSNNNAIVIVDEAYIDFGGESAMPLIKKYDNLLVVGTFSKSRALAGARIGYAAGSPELIRHIKDLKYSFNSYTINSLSEAIGAISLSDDAYFNETINKIVYTREATKQKLADMGFEFTDSAANFIFARHKHASAKELFHTLKEKNIYVRYFDLPRIDDYVRISVGTDEEMDVLAAVLSEIL